MRLALLASCAKVMANRIPAGKNFDHMHDCQTFWLSSYAHEPFSEDLSGLSILDDSVSGDLSARLPSDEGASAETSDHSSADQVSLENIDDLSLPETES